MGVKHFSFLFIVVMLLRFNEIKNFFVIKKH